MTIPIRPVAWVPCWRIIPTRYPEERILAKLAEPEDIDVVSDLEQMTNDRLRQEKGEIAIVAAVDIVSGPGSDYIMAPFTYRSPDGSRFSNGFHGVYYAARTLETAKQETKHHRQVFMSRTNEPPLTRCRRERNLIFEWDGKKIEKVYELREL